MIPMPHLKLMLLNYLLNSLWQVPALFLAATLAARVTRSAGPQTEHRIWVTAGFLEVTLPACAFAPALRNLFSSLFANRSARVTTQIAVVDAAAAHSHSHLGSIAAFTALLAYAALFTYFTARLVYRIHRTRALRHAAQPIALTGHLLATWQRCARTFAVHDAQLATSAAIAGPSTIGIRARVVLLPPSLLENLAHEDLAAALAHEFAHMQRRDFAKNLLYELIALPIAWHPFLWLTRHRIAESREMVCDELAAQVTHGTARYAHSLLRLAASFSSSTRPATLHTIGILDGNILERRVMKLKHSHPITAASRRVAVTAAVLLGLATCASAMSLRLEVPAQAISVTAIGQDLRGTPITSAESRALWTRSGARAQVRISGAVAAGQIISKVNPVYPPEARAQRLGGTVVLHAIIGKDGTIQQLAVISGPPILASSAMDAVKQWIYKPYLLNGEPVEVDTTITVNYSLDTQQAPAPAPPRDNSNETAQSAGPDAGVYNVGGPVRPPVITYSPAPEYPQEARDAKLAGNVIVAMVVDANGEPQDVRVARGLGNELDEKAVEAVQQYKFKPATRDGEPVPVNLKVEVNFQVF